MGRNFSETSQNFGSHIVINIFKHDAEKDLIDEL